MSTPSQQFLEKLNDIDLRIYGTTCGKIYIGEYVQSIENAVEILYPAELHRDESADHGVAFSEAIPGNGFQPMVLYFDAIVVESYAQLLLKKLYFDYLTIARFGSVISDELEDDQTSICHLEPKGLSDEYWKYIASRLKPHD